MKKDDSPTKNLFDKLIKVEDKAYDSESEDEDDLGFFSNESVITAK